MQEVLVTTSVHGHSINLLVCPASTRTK